MNKKYLELTKLIRSKQNDHEILKCLSNYHENDIADMLTVMTPKERKRIYTLLGPQKIAEIFAYLDEPQIYFSELSVKLPKYLSLYRKHSLYAFPSGSAFNCRFWCLYIYSTDRICGNMFLNYIFSSQQEEGGHFFRKNKFATAP